ncbi:unnamed protein product [Choristocarpus tenellus]
MGNNRAEGSVRYVSPVTARLFAKSGAVSLLGLDKGQILAASCGDGCSRKREKQRTHIRNMGCSSKCGMLQEDTVVLMATGGQLEVVCEEIDSRFRRLPSPQEYMEKLLRQRGYDPTPKVATKSGYSNRPSEKEIRDYALPLVDAVRRLDCKALQEMADNGTTMGAANKFGESVVHLATRRGNVKVLEIVLENGGSLHICDDFGKTPMHDACWTAEPHFDVVSVMLDRDPWLLQTADVRGATPLRYPKKEHWLQWNRFLDEVKDKYWPSLEPQRARGSPMLVRKDSKEMDSAGLVAKGAPLITVESSPATPNATVEPISMSVGENVEVTVSLLC